MGWRHYKIKIEDSLQDGSNLKYGAGLGVYYDESTVVDGKRIPTLYIREGQSANVTFEYINDKNNTVNNSSQVKWIFAAKGEDGKWSEIGAEGFKNLKISLTQVNEEKGSVTFSLGTVSDENVGRMFWIEPYFEKPEFPNAKKPKGFYAVFLSNPKVLSIRIKKEEKEEKIHLFGEFIELELETHRMPDVLMEKLGIYVKPYFEVTLASENNVYEDKPMFFMQATNSTVQSKGINSKVILKVPILSDIREKIEIGADTNRIMRMKFVVTSGFFYNDKVVYNEKEALEKILEDRMLIGKLFVFKYIEYNDGTSLKFLTEQKYVPDEFSIDEILEDKMITYSELRRKQIITLLKDTYKGDHLEKVLSSFLEKSNPIQRANQHIEDRLSTDSEFHDMKIDSSFDSNVFLLNLMSNADVLENIEKIKNETIQKIGDLTYEEINTHPCRFSAIEIEENGSVSRKHILFKEEAGPAKGTYKKDTHEFGNTSYVKDNTMSYYDIIGGYEAKRVQITLKGLTAEACDSKDLPKGQQHKNLDNVFQVDKYASDMGLVQQKEKLQDTFKVEDEIKNDQETKQSTQYYTKDYTNQAIYLDLSYNYNKEYNNTLAEILGYLYSGYQSLKETDMLDTAWSVRYFFTLFGKKENVSQKYFIPISSCRYQKQMARIRIFPNVSWWFNVKYNPAKGSEVFYVKQAPNYKYRIFNNGGSNKSYNRQVKEKHDAQRKNNFEVRDKKYEVSYEAFYSIDGKVMSLKLGEDFKVLKAISFIMNIYRIIQSITHSEEAKKVHDYLTGAEIRKKEKELRDKQSNQEALISMSNRRHHRQQLANKNKTTQVPFYIAVGMPSFIGGVYCEYAYSKKNPNLVGQQLMIKLQAKPLISAIGTLDLLYYAQFIGPIGQAIKRIHDFTGKLSLLTFGAANIDFFMNLSIECNLEVTIDGLTYHTVDGWSTPLSTMGDGGEVTMKAKVSLSLATGFNANWDGKYIGEGEISGEAKGLAEVEINFIDNPNTGKPAGVQFLGLKAEVTLKLKGKDRQKSREVEDSLEVEDENYSKEIVIIGKQEPWKMNFSF